MRRFFLKIFEPYEILCMNLALLLYVHIYIYTKHNMTERLVRAKIETSSDLKRRFSDPKSVSGNSKTYVIYVN